jgi:hypothetical protein
MPAGGANLQGLFTVGQSIAPQTAAATLTGTGIDFQDCGPEITVCECIGVNPGNDTTLITTVQESDDNGVLDAYAAITGATMTTVAGDTENQVSATTFYNRAARYCRAVMTVAGTSPTAIVCVLLACRRVSF